MEWNVGKPKTIIKHDAKILKDARSTIDTFVNSDLDTKYKSSEIKNILRSVTICFESNNSKYNLDRNEIIMLSIIIEPIFFDFEVEVSDNEELVLNLLKNGFNFDPKFTTKLLTHFTGVHNSSLHQESSQCFTQILSHGCELSCSSKTRSK